MSNRVFRTESLDLAAYLVTAGFQPEIVRAEELRRAIFEFRETEELRHAIVMKGEHRCRRDGFSMSEAGSTVRHPRW